ncbi:hypothetical protein ASE63_20255 [Bosea sp. Root381]|nr:hypothetical protein ASE63_20255 [Bosea sp. Root381]
MGAFSPLIGCEDCGVLAVRIRYLDGAATVVCLGCGKPLGTVLELRTMLRAALVDKEQQNPDEPGQPIRIPDPKPRDGG